MTVIFDRKEKIRIKLSEILQKWQVVLHHGFIIFLNIYLATPIQNWRQKQKETTKM